MTVALISLPTPQAVITVYSSTPSMIILPNGEEVHGAAVGWVSQDGVYSLVNVVPFVVPPGQQVVGPPSYSVSNGVVTETYQTQPIPPAQTAIATYQQHIAAGAVLTWSSSTTLNGTYPIDSTTMVTINAIYINVIGHNQYPSGNVVRPWPDINGVLHNMSVVQYKLFGDALIKYVDALIIAQQNAALGNTVTWPPNTISITG